MVVMAILNSSYLSMFKRYRNGSRLRITGGYLLPAFQEISYIALCRDILDWYRSKNIHLHGSFELSVDLWYSDGVRQRILDKAAFSRDNPIDLTKINDVPLRLEHLMLGSDLDVSQHLSFPLRLLVETMQKGFRHVEIQRASQLAKDKLKLFKDKLKK